jgi:hypothetical protein
MRSAVRGTNEQLLAKGNHVRSKLMRCVVTFVTPTLLARLPGVAFCGFPTPEPGALALLFLPSILFASSSFFFFWRPKRKKKGVSQTFARWRAEGTGRRVSYLFG